MIEGRGYGYTW